MDRQKEMDKVLEIGRDSRDKWDLGFSTQVQTNEGEKGDSKVKEKVKEKIGRHIVLSNYFVPKINYFGNYRRYQAERRSLEYLWMRKRGDIFTMVK